VKESPRQDDTPSRVPKDTLVSNPVDTSLPLPKEPHTPATSHDPSDTDSTLPTTPSSAVASPLISRVQNQVSTKSSTTALPIVPVVPILPPSPSTPRQPSKPITSEPSTTAGTGDSESVTTTSDKVVVPESADASQDKLASPPRSAAPKSWADLVRSKAQAKAVGPAVPTPANTSGLTGTRNESLVDVLNGLGTDVEQYGDKTAFLEPRGLVNTGNMCYMNSVRILERLIIALYCC
jgi:ubiquitin carboxyl-terminal hydrolase 10